MAESMRAQNGTTNPNAKLTVEQVKEIRQKHTNGHSINQLARRYGFGKTTIRSIVKRETWKDV